MTGKPHSWRNRCQPGNHHGLPASETDRRRRYSIEMQPRWNRAKSAARPDTSSHAQGLESEGNLFSFQSREKNVLDFSSYRSGVSSRFRVEENCLGCRSSLALSDVSSFVRVWGHNVEWVTRCSTHTGPISLTDTCLEASISRTRPTITEEKLVRWEGPFLSDAQASLES
jgi:hypothetical protein